MNDEPTREELAEEAKDLGVEGVSSMKKAELEKAVEKASGTPITGEQGEIPEG